MTNLSAHEAPHYEESLRQFLNSPIPGVELQFEDDNVAEEHGFVMDHHRLDDLKQATELISAQDGTDTSDLPPASFRADTVLIVASMLGSGLGKNHLSDEEVLEVDRLIFRGGTTHWLGLEVETTPLFEEVIASRDISAVSSQDVARYISGPAGGAEAPHLLGVAEPESFMGGSDSQKAKTSLGGQLLQKLLKHGPSEQVRDEDLSLLMEHYEQTGQILLGTNDQLVQEGDADQGSKAFWLLQLHEAKQKPLSQKQDESRDTLIKHYEDGSRRTEVFTSNNKAKIIFEAPNSIVNFGDPRAEEPILSVVAGYGQFSKIPYLPAWMKETEIADVPVTVLLDVYPSRYVISVTD